MFDGPTKIIVSVGSNLEADKRERVEQALLFLESVLDNCVASEPYETEPEPPSHHPYVNAVVCASTMLSEQELTDMFKAYEKKCGRTAASKTLDRIEIDVDIVCYGERIVRQKEFESSYFKTGLQKIAQRCGGQ